MPIQKRCDPRCALRQPANRRGTAMICMSPCCSANGPAYCGFNDDSRECRDSYCRNRCDCGRCNRHPACCDGCQPYRSIRITGPRGVAAPTDPITGRGTPRCQAKLYIDGVFVGKIPIDASGNWIYRPPTPWTRGCHCVRAVLCCRCDAGACPPEDNACFEVPGNPDIKIDGPQNGGGADPGDPVVGTGEPGCEAELYVDGVPVGRVMIDQSGHWIYQPPTPWTEGRHCVRAILRCPNDLSPNPPEDETCFEVPGIVITGPEDGGGADPEDPVTGTGEPGCEAELYIDGELVGRVPIDDNGNWIYQPPTPWTDGEHCVRAVLRCPNDPDPNPPEANNCFQVPGIKIDGPEDGGGADPDDPVIGTGEPGCEAELFVDGVRVGRVPIDQNGNWIYQPPTPWTGGMHCVRAILRCPGSTDPNPPTDNTCFEVPTVTIDGPENGGQADPGDPIDGTGEPGCEVELFIDGVSVGRVPVDENGNWTYQPPLPWTAGPHCVRAVLRCPDSTGAHPPEDTSCFDVVVPPCAAPDIDVPEDLAVIPSNQPSITGRGIPNSTVSVCLQDSSGNTLFCQMAHVFDDAEWGIQVPIMLADGSYTVVVTQLGINCIPAEAFRTFSVFTVDTSFFEVDLVSLTRGPVFRTVDTVFTTDSAVPHTLDIYYLLLVPGLPVPTAEEIFGYADPSTLTNGDAVRGHFTRNIGAGQTTLPFTLTGKEGVAALALETGVMDGFNYDIYATVSIDGGATLSGVLAVFQSAIGMPFASGNGTAGDPFVVRMCTTAEMAFYPDLTAGNPGNRAGVTENARILDNIEGMQALYDQTFGVHGLPDSLALNYALDASFDLANYQSAWSGNGWRPIGNVDAGLTGTPPSGPHIFSGVAQTAAGGTTVNNLRINATATGTDPVLVRGLFGQTRDVTLSGFNLPNPIVAALVTGSTIATQTGKIGALTGYAVGGQITGIALGTVDVSAGRAATGTNIIYAGGMVGIAQAVDSIANISVTQAGLSETTAQATVMGGIIGRLDQAGSNTSVQNVEITQVSVTAYQTMGGAVGEVLSGVAMMDGIAVGSVSLTHTGFRIGGVIGNLTASSASILQNLTVSQIQTGPVDPPSTAGYAGGLIGNTTQTASLTIQDSQVLAGAIHSGGRVGGAFGSLNVGAAGFVIRRVSTQADTFPNNGPAGGFIGRIDANTKITGALIVDGCSVTAATLTVTTNNTSSGFVGGFVGYQTAAGGASGATTPVLAFVDCETSVAVSHPFGTNTGGFVGAALLSSYLRCKASGSVIGNQNLGGFCGTGAGTATVADPSIGSLIFVLCQARGNVSATDTRQFANVATGGFVGAVTYALIDRCFASGNAVTAGDDVVSALVGQSVHRLLIRDSYSLGSATTPVTVSGGLVGTATGSNIERCYAAGAISCSSGAGGLLGSLSNDGTDTGRLALSFALNPSVAATNPGGIAHRVCATLGSGAQLVANYALNTMLLTAGGVPITPVDDPNGRDGQGTAQSNLIALIAAQGWNTTTVWDTSTVATLGRPTLFDNPET